MKNKFKQITVLTDLLSDPVISALFDTAENGENYPELLSALFKAGAEVNLCAYIEEAVLTDVNAFSKRCAERVSVSSYLKKAFVRDMQIIFDCVETIESGDRFYKGSFTPPFVTGNAEKTAENLITFYAAKGCGMFIGCKAFKFESGSLKPVYNTSTVTLAELKDYEYEKKVIGDNIENFITGLPFSHMLLYGDRGTGKSSTVHAMLNKYFDDGLRIIELNKENMLDIPKIREMISDNPLKFIIFIDDLALDEYDDKISSLKASLEGSISVGTDNAMITATSNRRHIVKESFSDRENSVHPSDSISEQLSLSDRFGLTVHFSPTDKAQYLSIIRQLARDKQIATPEEVLLALAERWALVKGGRSPRRARQFIDLVYSCEKRGKEIDF